MQFLPINVTLICVFECIVQVAEVVDFVRNLQGCCDYADDFALQEIDGQALMLLKPDHLMTAMSIKLGPALKICAQIEAMRAASEAANNNAPPSTNNNSSNSSSSTSATNNNRSAP